MSLYSMIYLITVSLGTGLVLYLVAFLISLYYPTSAKISPYECGFTAMGEIMIAFSCHFYVLALLFVIFDLEVVLFAGLVTASVETLFSGSFLATLVMGTFYLEWALGALAWRV